MKRLPKLIAVVLCTVLMTAMLPVLFIVWILGGTSPLSNVFAALANTVNNTEP